MTVAASGSRKARVLVVDDDARLRAMLVEYLERHEFETTPVATCAAAAKALTAAFVWTAGVAAAVTERD